ncbi:MAG: ankyrin repeat domain-containing protein [Candidatus Riflebacteria bacterium]|nr:ankyrin repeat domain-containing protein [Candidatus Riflebacteria bacterium]
MATIPVIFLSCKDEHEKNAFRLAVNNNNIKLAEALLVNYKYDVYSKDNLGRNAIWEWYGNSRNFYYDIPVLDFLLNIGYDINSTDDTFGDTLLLKAASDVRNFQLLEYLLKKGANLEVKNKYGDTALMRTAKRDGLNCNFFALIKAGANINVSDNYGSTLLSSLIYREKEFFSYYLYSKSCKSFPWYLLYVINYNLFEKENDEDLCDCENQK